METLFQFVARDHGVSVDQVRRSLRDRPKIFDWAVIISFAALYGLAAHLIIAQLCGPYWRRDEIARGSIMTVYISAVTSAAGMGLSDPWSGIMENIRLGNGHLSYRGARIPSQHHELVTFVCAMALFWVIAVFRYRASFRPKRPS